MLLWVSRKFIRYYNNTFLKCEFGVIPVFGLSTFLSNCTYHALHFQFLLRNIFFYETIPTKNRRKKKCYSLLSNFLFICRIALPVPKQNFLSYCVFSSQKSILINRLLIFLRHLWEDKTADPENRLWQVFLWFFIFFRPRICFFFCLKL